MKIRLSSKCEYVKQCPFYNGPVCDEYYKVDRRCGIKREVDEGHTWDWINLYHHKKDLNRHVEQFHGFETVGESS